MILEQQIERQIIDAIKADGDAVYYSGAWNVAQVGDVKGDESTDTGATVAVTVQPRVMPDYGGGVDDVEADFGVAVACSVSSDADPTGSLLMSIWERTSAKVWNWVKNQTAEQTTELTVTDEDGRLLFSPGGVQSNGGTPPTFVAQAHMWTWSISFTVKGIISE